MTVAPIRGLGHGSYVRDLGLAGIAFLACGGLLFAHAHDDALATFLPASFIIVALCNFASAAVLLNASSITPEDRRPNRLLAFGLGTSATFAFVIALVWPSVPGLPSPVAAGSQSGVWLYVFWRGLMAITAIGYALLRRTRLLDGPARGRVHVARRIGIGAFVVALLLLGVFFSDMLPPLAQGSDVSRFRLGGGIVFALAVAGTLLLGFLPRATTTDRSFFVSMVAVSLDIGLNLLVAERDTGATYAARAIAAVGAGSVMVALVRSLLLDRVRLFGVQSAFEVAVVQSGMRAKQFRALWQAASVDGLDLWDHLQAIVDIGASNIRPGRGIYGYLSHLGDGGVTIDALSYDGTPVRRGSDDENAIPQHLYAGAVEHTLTDPGRTKFMNSHEARSSGWQAYIGVPIVMGRDTYYLVFASAEPLADAPFAEDDVSFVDVLASQIATRYYQQDQLDRIRYQTEHDALTGLPNLTQLRRTLRLTLTHGRPLGVLRLNLDRFRDINEAEGHMIGDEVLVEVAVALRGVDTRDFIARMNGDDFAIVLPDVTSEAMLLARLGRYRSVFDRPFHTGDRDGTRYLPVTASFGAALFPRDAQQYETIMQCADIALDAAKKRGGETAVLFSDSMKDEADSRRLRRREIVEGIAAGTFDLEYQPTFDLVTRELRGAEALVRWNHPTRGRLMPGDFVPFAERNGVIGNLSRWIVHRLVGDLENVVLPAGFRCYMNLPAHLLDDAAFLGELELRLANAGDLADHLGIEITETEAVQNVDRTIVALQALRRRGLRIAIDDFGTGYSSLAHLKRLPIDMVKLDRAFVDGLPSDRHDVAVSELFFALTERLGVMSLAEGIETPEQAAWLQDHGCQLGQGFLVSRPLPFAAFRDLLADARRPLVATGWSQ